MKEIHVKAFWDSEAEVWVATSDDVPGLVTEAGDADELIGKLRAMIPELLEANGLLDQDEAVDIPMHISSERTETITYRPV
ncbi:DUF1902 domain-containing protein [Desulfoferrobacter suflitae]|uniref:DUF1902 domain-containing protein n=1 Tax=Desulfoferrobacter suflitae TaxID=2865782 RepID=UPI002164B01F|nr:DUF1902 domain-containing protein [Desulfoferrobacter suflitae]MCK8603320.1 DUF1902 domain-containing protein [Desulfoferrobacter suflitae]